MVKQNGENQWIVTAVDRQDRIVIRHVMNMLADLLVNVAGAEKHVNTGVELIAEERDRQITVEGWTVEHDRQWKDGELAIAAACYSLPEKRLSISFRKKIWPWDLRWWKPSPANRIRELQKAGALIAAEIDRLQAEKQPRT
ncbi:MAG: hypothetical protein WCI51_02140 [Lentisphaerota bacterium]